MKRRLTMVRSRPSSSVPTLEVRDLAKCFVAAGETRTVLEGVSLAAAEREIVCVLGRSGCGKTTLLNILAGFEGPSAGQVLLDGEPVLGPGPDRLVVFQEPILFPWLTVRENVSFGLKGRRDIPAHDRLVGDMLAQVGLDAHADFLPEQVSGGMRARAALARVLVLRPRVMLMDEPFASLDAQTREEMQGLLVRLQREYGTTMVFVTHDIAEAVTLADRIAVLGRRPGRIREIIEVPLPRPRDPESRESLRLRKRVRELFAE